VKNAVIAQFDSTYKEGFKYAAGFSFCPPTSIAMIKTDRVHMLTYSDAAHSYLSGVHLQTNLSDANSHAVPGVCAHRVLVLVCVAYCTANTDGCFPPKSVSITLDDRYEHGVCFQ
jgi:hypothetical protein